MIQKFYKKKRQYKNLLIGALWLFFAFSGFIFKDNYSLRMTDYGWMVLGVLHFGLYFFEHHLAYVTINQNVISRYSPFPKRMNINDITEVKKFPTNTF